MTGSACRVSSPARRRGVGGGLNSELGERAACDLIPLMPSVDQFRRTQAIRSSGPDHRARPAAVYGSVDQCATFFHRRIDDCLPLPTISQKNRRGRRAHRRGGRGWNRDARKELGQDTGNGHAGGGYLELVGCVSPFRESGDQHAATPENLRDGSNELVALLPDADGDTLVVIRARVKQLKAELPG